MRSNICIIGTANIKHISLISLYTRYFDMNGISYDIVYLDRYGIEEETSAQNTYKYTAIPKRGSFGRLKMFWDFRKYALKRIEEGRYKYIITWQTTGAYLFADKLMKKYPRRYVINVRDYVAEEKWLFKWLIHRLIKKALFVTLSSPGFKTFLPKYDYLRVNSINEDLLEGIAPIQHKRDGVVRIGFAGNCRYFQESFKLIDTLGNDPRFELWYCGTNSETLKDYAEQHNYTNVKTMPGFNPGETAEIMSGFDIVNSAFGNDARDNSTLIPIRLYTAVALHRPMLVNNSTQLAQEVTENSLGFVIENYIGLGEKLYSYYNSLNFEDLDAKCDQYMVKSRAENQLFYNQLDKLFS